MPADPAPLPPLAVALAELLARDGRSQKKLADAACLPQSSISMILQGRAPRPDTLVALCRALGLGPRRFGDLMYAAFPANDHQ